MEEVRLEIPMAALNSLPEGAEYRSQSGRASASVQTRGDTIVVLATCDSLQRLCERYERDAQTYRTALESRENEVRTETERRSNPWKALFVAFAVGMAGGIATTKLITKTKRL
jgi:hypothetical protein